MVFDSGIPRNRERHCRRTAALANGPRVDRWPKGQFGGSDPGDAGLVRTLRWLGSVLQTRFVGL